MGLEAALPALIPGAASIGGSFLQASETGEEYGGRPIDPTSQYTASQLEMQKLMPEFYKMQLPFLQNQLSRSDWGGGMLQQIGKGLGAYAPGMARPGIPEGVSEGKISEIQGNIDEYDRKIGEYKEGVAYYKGPGRAEGLEKATARIKASEGQIARYEGYKRDALQQIESMEAALSAPEDWDVGEEWWSRLYSPQAAGIGQASEQALERGRNTLLGTGRLPTSGAMTSLAENVAKGEVSQLANLYNKMKQMPLDIAGGLASSYPGWVAPATLGASGGAAGGWQTPTQATSPLGGIGGSISDLGNQALFMQGMESVLGGGSGGGGGGSAGAGGWDDYDMQMDYINSMSV